ncbi:alpha/beta fold hydrolase, partial [Microbacterium sp. Leaf351]
MNRPRLDPPVRRARRRRRWALAGVFALTAALIVVPSAVVRHVVQQQDAASLASFYEVPADLPAGSPGEIIRMRAIPEAPQGAQAWRIIYHTRDLQGRDIAASAVVVEPTVLAPHDGRVVVAWGHPTTGAAQNCAPSLATDPFELMEGLDTMLAAGFAVVAADYPGMGVAGASSYLLGVPESNSMLDAVRAARQLPSSDLSNQVLLWGHSQGGQASLFAAQRIGSYAPELHLVAVAVAAPAATLPTLLDDDIGDISGVSIASYAIPAMQAAYRDAYPTDDLGAILTSAGAAATPQ